MDKYNIYPALHHDLFAVVDYPKEITEQIGKAEPWRAFCELPLELKKQFYFSGENKQEDVGYLLRKRSEGREDKEYYHFDGARHMERIRERGLADTVKDNPVLTAFFEFCDATYHSATDMVRRIVDATETDILGLTDQVFREGKPPAMLRFLHYTPLRDDDPILADQHFDRGGFTLHLYESDSGLQLLDWDYKWIDAPISRGKTVVFTGYTLDKFTKGACQKTWHRVARIKNDARDNKGRFSIVYFIELSSDVPTYNFSARSQVEKPHYERTS